MKRLLQHVSDIGLQYHNPPYHLLMKPQAPILLLTGNIGIPDKYRYPTFLSYCSRNWDKVFLVKGPLETLGVDALGRYGTTPIEQSACLSRNFNNITVLDQTVEQFRDITFIGCGLWKVYDQTCYKFDPEYAYTGKINTIDKIRYLSIDEYEKDKRWLEEQIAQLTNESAVIVTHGFPIDILSKYHKLKGIDKISKWITRGYRFGENDPSLITSVELRGAK